MAVSALVRNTSKAEGCNACPWALLGTRHYRNYCVLRTPNSVHGRSIHPEAAEIWALLLSALALPERRRRHADSSRRLCICAMCYAHNVLVSSATRLRVQLQGPAVAHMETRFAYLLCICLACHRQAGGCLTSYAHPDSSVHHTARGSHSP